MKTTLRTALAILITVTASASAVELGPDASELKEKLVAAQTKAEADCKARVESLGEGFDGALIKLDAKFKEQANLDALLEVRELRVAFKLGGDLPTTTNAEALRLLKTYHDHVAEARAELEKKSTGLLVAYANRLGPIVEKLTKAGEAATALAVRDEIEKTRAQRAALNEKALERERAIAAAAEAAIPMFDLMKIAPSKVEGGEWFHKTYHSKRSITVDGTTYPVGERIFAHPDSALTWEFDEAVTNFQCLIANRFPGGDDVGSGMIFRVLSGDRTVYESEILGKGKSAKIDISFKPTKELTLVTDAAGSLAGDHAFWVRPRARAKAE